jgi:hypothetical protein
VRAGNEKQAKGVHMEHCAGMTLFSYADEDELSEEDTVVSSAGSSSRNSPNLTSTLQKALVDTMAGMTFFRTSDKPQVSLENVTAGTSCGITLYSSPDQEHDKLTMQNVRADTCGGMTMFTPCDADTDEKHAQHEGPHDEACLMASDTIMGFTDFGPALAKLRQDPERYTEEQKWLSDLAWAVCA